MFNMQLRMFRVNAYMFIISLLKLRSGKFRNIHLAWEAVNNENELHRSWHKQYGHFG